jgi:hypothetical protein
MDLHWNVCPYCGNDHIDPYHVGPPLVLADDVVTEEEALAGSVDDPKRAEQAEEDERGVDEELPAPDVA